MAAFYMEYVEEYALVYILERESYMIMREYGLVSYVIANVMYSIVKKPADCSVYSKLWIKIDERLCNQS